jgi:glutamate-1-semialdehyde 2,1-aminomutase
MLREVTRAKDVFLIFDEVMTSRLSPGGLQQAHGVIPDMTTLGKYIGGGMSFGAFGGTARVMERFDPRRKDAFGHAGTFNNNVLTMSAGIAALSEIYTPEAALALNARGDKLRERLNDLARSRGARLQFTGRGSMMNAHFTLEPIGRPADAAKGDMRLRDLLFFDLLARGYWLARRGMINLSLPLTDGDLDGLVDAVGEFLEARRSLVAA